MRERPLAVAGLDIGTECVKAVVLDAQRRVVGQSVVPTHGYFQEVGQAALGSAVDEAQVAPGDLAGLCITGFGRTCMQGGTMLAGEAVCHARGAFHHRPERMTVVDLGGRDPQVIRVGKTGRPEEIFGLRRCAIGIGTFLMYASRHLDVHPTRMQELAAAVEVPATVGSYCNVFAGSEILDRLREGASREEVALGCMHSVAERIVEIGGFEPPVRFAGGVIEYFPGVLRALVGITGVTAEVLPDPIMTAALGAALMALEAAEATAAVGAGG